MRHAPDHVDDPTEQPEQSPVHHDEEASNSSILWHTTAVFGGGEPGTTFAGQRNGNGLVTLPFVLDLAVG